MIRVLYHIVPPLTESGVFLPVRHDGEEEDQGKVQCRHDKDQLSKCRPSGNLKESQVQLRLALVRGRLWNRLLHSLNSGVAELKKKKKKKEKKRGRRLVLVSIARSLGARVLHDLLELPGVKEGV